MLLIIKFIILKIENTLLENFGRQIFLLCTKKSGIQATSTIVMNNASNSMNILLKLYTVHTSRDLMSSTKSKQWAVKKNIINVNVQQNNSSLTENSLHYSFTLWSFYLDNIYPIPFFFRIFSIKHKCAYKLHRYQQEKSNTLYVNAFPEY